MPSDPPNPADELHARSKSPAFAPVPRVKTGADGRSGVLPGTPHAKEPDPELGHDIIDAVLYAFKLSPAYAWMPEPPKPAYGSPEWAKSETSKMFQDAVDHFQGEASSQAEWDEAIYGTKYPNKI